MACPEKGGSAGSAVGRVSSNGGRERGVSCGVREPGSANEAVTCAMDAESLERRFPANLSCIFDSSRLPLASWKGSVPAVLSRKAAIRKALLGGEAFAEVTTQHKGHRGREIIEKEEAS